MQTKSTYQKHVVIVGGSAGGMSCATRVRRLDESAHITVIEDGPFVSYATCGLPYALSDVIEDDTKLILQTPGRMASVFNINVLVDVALVSIDRDKSSIKLMNLSPDVTANKGKIQCIQYDNLVLAFGAKPRKPAIPGIEHDHVFTLQNIPDLRRIKNYIRDHNCQDVAIIGGGFIGLEVAENLSKAGMLVTILEYANHVLPPLDNDIAFPIEQCLSSHGIKVILNARIQRIMDATSSETAQIVLTSHGAVRADLVVVCAGNTPQTAIADQAGLLVGEHGIIVEDSMQTSDLQIYAVGDLVETRSVVTDTSVRTALAGPANRQGRIAADQICGIDSRYRGSLGTAITKVFDLTVGVCGFSMEALEKTDLVDSVSNTVVHPLNHAGYYPGATAMQIKVVFDSISGRLLGAQVLGREGVDKRLDVLSMAIMAGMSIEDLEHVELAYAPPFSSAKDPVNMAGFAGGNQFRKTTSVVDPRELIYDLETNCDTLFQTGDHDFDNALEQKYQIVDVRGPDEFAKGHLIGAVNLPLDQIRSSMSSLDMTRSILVYCWVGYRGYLAQRILRQNGFSVLNLNGGLAAVIGGGYNKLIAYT